MATLAKKVAENIPGEFFVSEDCIDCDLCRQSAPLFFARKFFGNMGYTYVQRQPASVRERDLCLNALRACPVDAIGRN
jgi:ferredoxin